MNFFTAALLGILQGVTEFLPISSTAHLTLTGKVLGLIDPAHPEAWTQFIAVMQLGTLVATLFYFWKEILTMTSGVLRDLRSGAIRKGWRGWSPDTRLAIAIALGTLPVGIVGFAFKRVIEGTLTKSTAVIASSLIVLAALLWLAERVSKKNRGMEDLSPLDAIVVGCAQALALIPGSSRSGTTLTGAMFLSFTRETAARFSFLLSIPAVAASGLFELVRIDETVFELGMANLAIATIVSAVSGYAAIAWLLRYLMRHTVMVFVWYRIALGLLLAVLLAVGVMDH